MKKIIAIILIICILSVAISILELANKKTNPFDSQSTSIQFDNTMSNQQMYYDLFITMLYLYVEKAIADYYSEYMTYPPSEDPFDYKFTKIEKTPELNYSYTVELEVQPYVGPHLSVGRDRITFNIELDEVSIEKFEHIESYELPPNYQDIIKKKLPTT